MMRIEILNKTGKSLSGIFLRRVVRRTLSLAGRKKPLFLSVTLVGKKEMRKINRTWRKKDEPTDVLSFNYSPRYNNKEIEGEIILCPEIIRKAAERAKVPFRKESARVLAHGILHILGMWHGKKMSRLQDEVSNLKF